MKFILVLILLLPSKGISDHYKTGFFFSDPNYRGCIWVYDIVDGKNSCVERSPKFYFHEGKHKGSMGFGLYSVERETETFITELGEGRKRQ